MQVTRVRNKNLDALKIIAISTMVIDHLRFAFTDYSTILVSIGRVAFICFASMLAYNCYQTIKKNKTSSLINYSKNFILFGLVSEIPYRLMLDGHKVISLNIMWTLFLGFLSIVALEAKTNEYIRSALLMLVLGFCWYFSEYIQYGFIGVLSILGFYLYFKAKDFYAKKGILLLLTLGFIWNTLKSMSFNTPVAWFKSDLALGLTLGCLSGLLISVLLLSEKIDLSKYNIPKVGKLGWAFYPVHMIIIWLLIIVLR